MDMAYRHEQTRTGAGSRSSRCATNLPRQIWATRRATNSPDGSGDWTAADHAPRTTGNRSTLLPASEPGIPMEGGHHGTTRPSVEGDSPGSIRGSLPSADSGYEATRRCGRVGSPGQASLGRSAGFRFALFPSGDGDHRRGASRPERRPHDRAGPTTGGWISLGDQKRTADFLLAVLEGPTIDAGAQLGRSWDGPAEIPAGLSIRFELKHQGAIGRV